MKELANKIYNGSNQQQQQQQSSQQQSNNILSEESANKFRYANVNSNNDEFQATA